MNKGFEVGTTNGPSLVPFRRVCRYLHNGWGQGKWGLYIKVKQGKEREGKSNWILKALRNPTERLSAEV